MLSDRLLGVEACGRGDYAEAKRIGQEALSLDERHGELWQRAGIYSFVLGEAAVGLGDYAEAKRHTQQAFKLFQEVGQLWGIATNFGELGNIAVALEEFEEARYYYQQQLRLFAEAGRQPSETLNTLLLFARLMRAEGNRERAVELLTLTLNHRITAQTRDKAERLRTQMQAELHPKGFAAARERGEALDFAAVVAELLTDSAIAPSKPVGSQTLIEALSVRELEVLRLIADGLANAEIAAKLFLTTGTIKAHTRSIYSKLGVNSRTQAVAQAQKLNLF
ncbi:MAG: LuxR C-terminal-related transcriptional regulator [Aggregatilineales bacterium]